MSQTIQRSSKVRKQPHRFSSSINNTTARFSKDNPRVDKTDVQHAENKQTTSIDVKIAASENTTRKLSKRDICLALVFLLAIGSLVWLSVTAIRGSTHTHGQMKETNPTSSSSSTKTTPSTSTTLKGNENIHFFLAFLDVYHSQFDIGLRIATEQWSNFTIRAPGIELENSIRPNSTNFSSVQLPISLMSTDKGIGMNGIEIIGADTDMTVIGVLPDVFNMSTNDAFLVLSEAVLSNNYFIASYHPVLNSYNHTNGFVIVSTANNTDVSITFKLSNSSNVTLEGKSYRSGSQLNISLNKLNTFYIKSSYDLTGTGIRSNKNIAVFAGSYCTAIPVHVPACDTLAEQMLPLNAWSKQYIVAPVYPRSGYVVRILASVDATAVHINNNSHALSEILNAGDFHELLLGTGPLVVTSDHAVSVVQYGVGEKYDSTHGDPFMTVMLGIDRFQESYKFFCFPKFQCYASITIETEFEEGVLLDNDKVNPANRTAVPDPFKQYTTLHLTCNEGSHTIRHSSDKVKFGVHVYGLKFSNSFGYSAGYEVEANR